MNCNKDGCAHWRNCDSISQKHCTKSWKNLVRLWRAQKLCDVVIVVQDKRFPCHGIVPASTSPFFRNAFLRKSKMSATDSMLCEKEVIVDFMTKEIFAQVLNFMYTADVDVKSDRVRSLILAAAKLEMQGMVNAIMRNILDWEIEQENLGKTIEKHTMHHKKSPAGAACRRLGPGDTGDSESDIMDAPIPGKGLQYPSEKLTVCGLMDELRLQGDLATLTFAQTFAARNFSKISATQAFLSASVHTVASLLEDDRLNMEEFLVFQALSRWLEAEQMHLVHGPYLLSKIRLQLLTPTELADHVETKDYLMRKKKSRVLILEAFRFHCLKRSAEMNGIDPPPPRGQRKRIGVLRPDDSDADDWTVGEDGQLYKDEASPYCPVRPCSCCPNYILASGGIDTKSKSASDGVYKYEERENSWSRFARLQQPRNHHAAVYCKGYLYILGGSDPSLTGPGAEVCPVASCYRLGLESLKWSKIDSMSTPRMSLQAIHKDGYIYAIGGQDHKQRILRDIERYSIDSGVWEFAGTLSSVRAGIAVSVHKKKMWVAGGYCHKSGAVLDTVETFDEEFGSWQPATPLRFPRCFANLLDSHNQMFVIGGAWLDSEMDCGSFSSVYDVDKYNDDTNIWEGLTSLRVGRHDAGYAVLGPRLYIIGGKHCDDGSINNLDTVECFDLEKEDWIDGVTSLPLPLLGPAITFTT
uniref:kelch-like protein 18 n=1 Tax=Styela clava TaxID=7725 RepID=UPI001939D67C|nr:kelch-like protein 18 [Styela clava]